MREEKCFISDGDLLVEPIPFLEINALELEEQLNEHTSLWVRGKIRAEGERELNTLASSRTEIVLKTRTEIILFRGTLKELNVEHSGRQVIVEAKVLSHSCLLDGRKKKRPFHKANKTVEDLIRTVARDTTGADVIAGGKCRCDVGSFLMQYEESDWEFMKRAASLANQTLIPDIMIEYPALYVGRPMETVSREILEPDSYSTVYDGGNFYRVNSRRDWLKLGEKVRFLGLELYVRKVYVTLRQAVLCGTYELCFRDGLDTDKKENKVLAGKNVKGIVQKIKRDRVCVNVMGADGNENGAACWFPYSTIYASADGSGWYCMPEAGDHVRIQFADGDEKNAYAVSAVSTYTPDKGQGDRMKDYTRRYIRNKQGMEIQWTPEYVRISANGASMAEINKSGTVSLTAGKELVIRAGQDISIHAGRDVQINSGKGTHVSCGVKAELNMDDSGMIELKGNEIYTN